MRNKSAQPKVWSAKRLIALFDAASWHWTDEAQQAYQAATHQKQPVYADHIIKGLCERAPNWATVEAAVAATPKHAWAKAVHVCSIWKSHPTTDHTHATHLQGRPDRLLMLTKAGCQIDSLWPTLRAWLESGDAQMRKQAMKALNTEASCAEARDNLHRRAIVWGINHTDCLPKGFWGDVDVDAAWRFDVSVAANMLSDAAHLHPVPRGFRDLVRHQIHQAQVVVVEGARRLLENVQHPNSVIEPHALPRLHANLDAVWDLLTPSQREQVGQAFAAHDLPPPPTWRALSERDALAEVTTAVATDRRPAM